MKPNQHLKEIALLGSARKSLDPTLLPDSIGQLLESKSFNNTEDKVLEALSLHHYYSLAGTLPQKYTGTIDQNPITEKQPVIDEELENIYKQILELEAVGKERLLNSWLDKVISKGQIISSNQIVSIIKIAKTSSKKTRAKVLQVIGEKGKWAMGQSEDLLIGNVGKSKTDTTIDPQAEATKIWTEGNAAIRKLYFTTLRQENKNGAIALLGTTWREEGIRDKQSFLKVISETFAETDIPLLEELLADEFKFKPKEKPTVKSCRRIVSDTLLFMSSTDLHKKTVEIIAGYIGNGKSKGLLAKVFSKGKVAFNLPTEHDDFWNPQVMSETYGFDETNPDISQYQTDALYWFACFVQSIPFVSWKKILNVDAKSVLNFFLSDKQFLNVKKGISESNLLFPLFQSAKNHKDQELTLYLLKLKSRLDMTNLLKLLEPKNWEKYLTKNDLLYSSHILNSCNLEEGREWSKSFTDNFTKKITKRLHERKQILDYQVGVTAATYYNVDSLPLLKKIHQTEANMLTQYNWWAKHFYSRIMETTSIRSQLKNYK